MNKRTIYISIPMAGKDMGIQRQFAHLWQKFFENQGYIVINPFILADKLKEEYHNLYKRVPTYSEYLNNDLDHIEREQCTDMFMCDGWATSPGCLQEVYKGMTLKINFLYESKFKLG